MCIIVFEGSLGLEVKFLTILTDGKAEVGRVREEKRREEDTGARKSRKVVPMICGSGRSKSRLAKAAGAEPSGQMKNENCTPLWREARVKVKMYKTC